MLWKENYLNMALPAHAQINLRNSLDASSESSLRLRPKGIMGH